MPTFLNLLWRSHNSDATTHHTFQIVLERVDPTSRFKKVGIFFFCCLLENGWGNPVETSCLATLTAIVVRKKVLAMNTQQEPTLKQGKEIVRELALGG